MRCSYLPSASTQPPPQSTSYRWTTGGIAFIFSLRKKTSGLPPYPPRILLCQSHFSTRRSDSADLRLNFRSLRDVFYTYQELNVIHSVVKPRIRASLMSASVDMRSHAIIIIAPPLLLLTEKTHKKVM